RPGGAGERGPALRRRHRLPHARRSRRTATAAHRGRRRRRRSRGRLPRARAGQHGRPCAGRRRRAARRLPSRAGPRDHRTGAGMSGADAGSGTVEDVTVRAVVVDDHPVVRDGLVAMLGADPGIEVVGSAEDGSEGLRLIERTDPDIVLMDLRMPGTGGTEAIRRLRSRDRERPRVLVLTTYDTDRDIRGALEAGADGFLLKDARREDVLRAVHDL